MFEVTDNAGDQHVLRHVLSRYFQPRAKVILPLSISSMLCNSFFLFSNFISLKFFCNVVTRNILILITELFPGRHDRDKSGLVEERQFCAVPFLFLRQHKNISLAVDTYKWDIEIRLRLHQHLALCFALAEPCIWHWSLRSRRLRNSSRATTTRDRLYPIYKSAVPYVT